MAPWVIALGAAAVSTCLASCVNQRASAPAGVAPAALATQPPVSGSAVGPVDGLNVVAFDLVRTDGVTVVQLEHIELGTWRVTFPGLNARTARVNGRSVCCITFSDFDFLGISAFDVTGPDIGGEDRVGVRAANLAGP